MPQRARPDRRPQELAGDDGVPHRRVREQARNEAVDGLHRWHNEYNVWTLGRPERHPRRRQVGAARADRRRRAPGAGAGVIGTPDELVAAIRHLQEITGGFGVVLGFAHDWANREATMRSWDLFARYVIPEINGYTVGLRESQEYLNRHQAELMAGARRPWSARSSPTTRPQPRCRPRWSRLPKPQRRRKPSSRSSAPAAASPRHSTDSVVWWRSRWAVHQKCHANVNCQSSLRATAFGVTFIFGS